MPAAAEDFVGRKVKAEPQLHADSSGVQKLGDPPHHDRQHALALRQAAHLIQHQLHAALALLPFDCTRASGLAQALQRGVHMLQALDGAQIDDIDVALVLSGEDDEGLARGGPCPRRPWGPQLPEEDLVHGDVGQEEAGQLVAPGHEQLPAISHSP